MARAKGPSHAAKPAAGFVLDNSIVMAWIFEDETNDYAEAVLARLASPRRAPSRHRSGRWRSPTPCSWASAASGSPRPR